MSTHYGYFLIADITGYTSYLSKSELDHAQQSLIALLNLLIKHTKPPLIISRLAGDAVISYGLRDNFFQGQTFVEMIEDTYVAFRRAIELMVLNTTCTCNACANITSLDLKFFVHYGAFGIQKLDNHDEMVGADVIVIHRLLKNTVTETFGQKAYCLYTDAVIKQLQLEDICETMQAHREEYEHLGAVPVWVQDMHPVWEAKKASVRVAIPQEHHILTVEANIAAPPEVVWDYLSQTEHRMVLIGSDRQEIIDRKGGRVGEGATYQCYHGDMIVPQTIIEWLPFERVLTEDLVPIPIKDTYLYGDYRLEPHEDGTRLIQEISFSRGPNLGRWLNRMMCKMMGAMMKTQYQRDMDKFKNHIEDDLVRRGSVSESACLTPEVISAAAVESLAA
jgi:hypothetical protein